MRGGSEGCASSAPGPEATGEAAAGSSGGNASGGSSRSMNSARASIEGASSKSWRKVMRTLNVLCNAVLACVRKSESKPSSRKVAWMSSSSAESPLSSCMIFEISAVIRSLRCSMATTLDVFAAAPDRSASGGPDLCGGSDPSAPSRVTPLTSAPVLAGSIQ